MINPFSGACTLRLAGTKPLVASERRIIIINTNPGDSMEIRRE